MKKFTKSINIENYEVLSDTGWVSIDRIHETIKYEIYEVHLENGYCLKWADDHILFNEKMEEVYCKDLQCGQIIITDEGKSVVKLVIKTEEFDNMYDLELSGDSNHRYYTNGILSHNTQLAKELSRFMFGNQDSLIRVDMSEYGDKFNSTKLIGAPPGYVGHEEGGQLTEKVRRKPYSIILFDEIEKAHPDIFNTLLQILDEGSITDGLGRKIDFKNTLIILTSNIGSRKLQDFGDGVGFRSSSKEAESEIAKEILLKKELQKAFSPEFINRLDDIVYFKELIKEDMLKILEVELSKVLPRIESLGYKINLTQRLKEEIAEKGYDPKFGARPLKRIVQRYIEDSIADLMVMKKAEEGSTITLDYDEKKAEKEQMPVKISVRKSKPKKK
jgi:ATP-dependent Clp protease ATP-binding subunit ClpC